MSNESAVLYGENLEFAVPCASNVYMLAHRTANLVKIGKANSIISRAASLRLDDFDLSKSIGLQVKTERDAFDLERILHTVFKTHRLSVAQVSGTLNHDSGMTEWFSSDCMGRAQEFLAHINDMVPFKQMDVIAPDKTEKKKKTNLTNQDKEIRRLEAETKTSQINATCLNEFNTSFERLSKLVTFTGTENHRKDSFEVFFSHEVNADLVIDLLGEMRSNGIYNRASGMTSVMGCSLHQQKHAGHGYGRFEVLRPHSKANDGSDGQAIESLFSDFLEFLRSIPSHKIGANT